MFPRPFALPLDPDTQAAMENFDAAETPSRAAIGAMLRLRRELALHLGRLDSEIQQIALRTFCGPDESIDVEDFADSLGFTAATVLTLAQPVGMLRWANEGMLRAHFGMSIGRVAGQAWGSGGLVGEDLFLTAGHCFGRDVGGLKFPSRNGDVISPEEAALQMHVEFGFQKPAGGITPRVPKIYPVVELLEHSKADYAILRLGPGSDGYLPGHDFDVAVPADTDLTAAGAPLCMIGHRNGEPMRAETGPMLSNVAGTISYDTLDTAAVSSGSLLYSLEGQVVGIHTTGGCTNLGGSNSGVAIGLIRAVSAYL